MAPTHVFKLQIGTKKVVQAMLFMFSNFYDSNKNTPSEFEDLEWASFIN